MNISGVNPPIWTTGLTLAQITAEDITALKNDVVALASPNISPQMRMIFDGINNLTAPS